MTQFQHTSTTQAVPYRGYFKNELLTAIKENGGFLGLYFVNAQGNPITFVMLSCEEEEVVLQDVKNKVYYSSLARLRGANVPDDVATWSRFLVTPPSSAKVSGHERISLKDYLAVKPQG